MPFSYCLNTSTIRSEGLSILDAIDTAADAGWDGIEPWAQELDDWVAGGGTLQQVRDRAGERDLAIVNLIASRSGRCRRTTGGPGAWRRRPAASRWPASWAAPTWPPRLGDPRPPRGAGPGGRALRRLVDLAAKSGVIPLLEFWGIAQTLGSTGEILLVAAECGRPGVQMLTDVFHMYKGSGHHFGLEHFGSGRLGLVHVNDYPAAPGRSEVTDADRVYPGDGLAPWPRIVAMLEGIGYEGMLSLELFNEGYRARGPVAVAREGLEKLKRCVEG